MKRKRLGFTLIEVSLFLAVTGLLFAGIIIGTQNALRDQRFYDSTQNFVEFLKSVYSQVSNPQSIGKGDSIDKAIYGKLVVFGESTGLDGAAINNDGIQRVFVYDVVGDAGDMGTGDVRTVLNNLQANVVVEVKNSAKKVIRVDPAGLVEDYTPRWDAQIETTAKGASRKAFTGSLLIVRHPNSGTINTLFSDEVIQVNALMRDANNKITAGRDGGYQTILTSKLSTFDTKEVDFCVNPEGASKASELRRDIRIVSNARNSSGVELVDLDGAENRCR